MYCPKCANQTGNEQKFCNACGTNLMSVSMAMQDPRSLMTENEWRRSQRKGEKFSEADFDAVWKRMGSQRGMRSRGNRSAENPTKLMQSGIIVGCVGMGVTIFLYILFNAIAKTETNPEDIAVLHSMWAVGLIPFFVGLGLFLSGLAFRHKPDQTVQQSQISLPNSIQTQGLLPEQREETFTPSVTEHTTRNLQEEPFRHVRSAHDTKEVN